MKLVKVKEDGSTITLGWEPVPGAQGYLFYRNGVQVSRTFDPKRRTVRISKPGVYRVQAISFTVVDEDTYPDAPAPTAKKVAPITVRQEGGSDQRVCLFTGEEEGGPLRPGVRQLPDGRYTDESGALYQSNGLEDSSIRTKATDPRLVGARSMDGRNACQCPPVGSPDDNTGSWQI